MDTLDCTQFIKRNVEVVNISSDEEDDESSGFQSVDLTVVSIEIDSDDECERETHVSDSFQLSSGTQQLRSMPPPPLLYSLPIITRVKDRSLSPPPLHLSTSIANKLPGSADSLCWTTNDLPLMPIPKKMIDKVKVIGETDTKAMEDAQDAAHEEQKCKPVKSHAVSALLPAEKLVECSDYKNCQKLMTSSSGKVSGVIGEPDAKTMGDTQDTAPEEKRGIPAKRHAVSAPLPTEKLVECSNYKNCQKLMTKSGKVSGVIAPFCQDCSFWVHAHHYQQKFCVPNGSKDCFYCAKLMANTGRKNFMYVNKETLDYTPPKKSASSAPKRLLKKRDLFDVLPNVPQQTPDKWKFFMNYESKAGLNIKLGDCVYFAQVAKEELAESKRKKTSGAERSQKPLNPWAYAQRVSYIIEEEDGMCYISGNQFYSVRQVRSYGFDLKDEETCHHIADFNYSVKNNRKQLIVINDICGWVPLRAVTEQFSALLESDYKTGRPRGFDKKSVFQVSWQYSYHHKTLRPYNEDKYHYKCVNPIIWKKGKACKTENRACPLSKKSRP